MASRLPAKTAPPTIQNRQRIQTANIPQTGLPGLRAHRLPCWPRPPAGREPAPPLARRVCLLAKSVQSFWTLRHYRLWPERFLCPWDSRGKNNGAGCHALFQVIFPNLEWNPCLLRLLHWRVLLPVSHRPPRVVVALIFSRGSAPGDCGNRAVSQDWSLGRKRETSKQTETRGVT